MQLLLFFLPAVAAIRLAAPAPANATANGTMGYLRTFAEIEAAVCGSDSDFLQSDDKDFVVHSRGSGMNFLVHSRAPRQTPEVCATLKKFRVCGDCSGGSLERLGEDGDGGYLMCPAKSLSGAISLGINGFDGFGAELSQKYNIPVQQYDCFNTKAPAVPYGADCKFAPLCVKDKTYQNSAKFKTLSEFAAPAPGGDLVLKMDVEGADGGALDSAPPATLARFEQIALEVHSLHETWRYDQFDRVMDKLLANFVLVYNHGNNCRDSVRLGNYMIPRVFELSFVRKNGPVQSTPCVSNRPTAHDNANCHWNRHPIPVKLPSA
jgi:hypothetical protein